MLEFTNASNEVWKKVLRGKKSQDASVDTWKPEWAHRIKENAGSFIHHYHDGKQKSKGSLQADKEFNDLIEEVEKQGLVAEVQRKKVMVLSLKYRKLLM
jgi:hypothetical protein